MIIYDRVKDKHCDDNDVLNPDLERMIHQTNLRFWKDKLTYNAEFYDFMRSLLSLPLATECEMRMKVLECGLLFFFSVLVPSGERDILLQWSNQISGIIKEDIRLSKMVLEFLVDKAHSAVCEKILLKESSHTAVMRLVVTAIECPKEPDQIKELRSLAFKLSNSLLEAVEKVSCMGKHEVAIVLSPLAYLFYPLKSAFNTQPDIANLMLRKGIPITLLSLLVFDCTSFGDLTSANDDLFMASSIQNGLIAALSTMLSELLRRGGNASESPLFQDALTIASTGTFTLSIIAQIKAVFGIKFVGSRVSALQNIFNIIRFVVWESLRMTSVCLHALLDFINRSDAPDLKDAFRLAGMLMRVDDHLIEERVDLVMSKLMMVMESNSRFSTATEVSIDMCLRIVKVNSLARKWLVENSTKCSWMEKWLEKRRFGAVPGSIAHKSQPAKKKMIPSIIALNKRNMEVSCNGFCSSPSMMLSALKRILNDDELNEYFYDSDDDPKSLIGKKIEVKWAYNNYYTGEVVEYSFFENEMAVPFDAHAEGLHRVVYDDGDVKWHKLALKTWRFV